MKEQRHKERDERKKIVIWRKPLTTLHYFILEIFELIKQEKARFVCYDIFFKLSSNKIFFERLLFLYILKVA